eukprot:2065388-Pyramimonas_sp.AAC.1
MASGHRSESMTDVSGAPAQSKDFANKINCGLLRSLWHPFPHGIEGDETLPQSSADEGGREVSRSRGVGRELGKLWPRALAAGILMIGREGLT